MIGAVLRKAGNLAADPVLRRWLVSRLAGRWGGGGAFTPHRPPYLEGLLPLTAEKPHWDGGGLAVSEPAGPITLPLASLDLTVEPGGERALFERRFDDIETLLSVHRFAWLPLLGDGAEPAWVDALWRAWLERHGTPTKSWPWHPYTAAERAVNILTFARRHGLPGSREGTLEVLAAHAPAIAGQLEYFGDHHTSNHLANNGRGLFLIGLALGMEGAAGLGGRILIEEAGRIFASSGVLREGSSHYHLLVARWYTDCLRAARERGRPEAGALEGAVGDALAVIPHLLLPGGLPLIGDVSPDCPPETVLGDLAETAAEPCDAGDLAADGWLSAGFGPWAGLWHAAPGGWSQMPGHGHQDCGSFELHYTDEALFRDLGRGAYGEAGEAAFYRSAATHNTLLIDGADPYPPNKPYYADDFRLAVGGPPLKLRLDDAGVTLSHHGFARLSGGGAVKRIWRFTGNGMRITDHAEGNGRHRLTRLLHTTLPVEQHPDGIVIAGHGRTYRVAAEDGCGASLRPATYWSAYGRNEPAMTLVFETEAALPWDGALAVKVL